MTVFTSKQAAPARATNALGWSRAMFKSVGLYEVDVTFTAADKLNMCKLPRGAVITGGWLKGDKLDSAGSGSALASINIGVDCACKTLYDRTSISAASTSIALLDTWSIGPDAAASVHQELGYRNVPLGGLLSTVGPLVTQDDCNVYVTWTSSILALTSGTMILEVDYYMETV